MSRRRTSNLGFPPSPVAGPKVTSIVGRRSRTPQSSLGPQETVPVLVVIDIVTLVHFPSWRRAFVSRRSQSLEPTGSASSPGRIAGRSRRRAPRHLVPRHPRDPRPGAGASKPMNTSERPAKTTPAAKSGINARWRSAAGVAHRGDRSAATNPTRPTAVIGTRRRGSTDGRNDNLGDVAA